MAASILPPSGFYVYTHRKATTGEIFYVGKGHGRRAWLRTDRSAHWRNIVTKHGLTVEIVADGLQEWYAFELECDLIALHGRRDQGNGPLVNWTDGGEGASGRPVSEVTRAAIRAKATGKKITSAMRKILSTAHIGKTHTLETKAKISASNYARPRKTFTGRSKVAVVRSDGVQFESTQAAEYWCIANVNAKASKSNIVKCCRGKLNFAYGYTWRYAQKETGAVAPVIVFDGAVKDD